MFWRSVVGKLAITILLLVSFVLTILTVLLLGFFESFHVSEAENDMMKSAGKMAGMIEQYEDQDLSLEHVGLMKDSASRVVIINRDKTAETLDSTDHTLNEVDTKWLKNDEQLKQVLDQRESVQEETVLPNSDVKAMIVGTPIGTEKALYIYKSLKTVNKTKDETTKLIFLAAGIAIILTIVFAFFLSTRITKPLIKMRKAALDLTKGEFNTKVPVLTHDEIGELAMAFNRMGRQLQFHINALRQEKEQISSIVSSMADGVITLNWNGNMLLTNPPAQQFIQSLYYEQGIETSDKDQATPEPLNEILATVIRDETEVTREIDTQGRTWVMIMTPLYNQTTIRGAVAVIRDMTEERQMDKMRQDFIANVSHELRTPISMLQGYSEAIVDDVAETTEEKNELAEIIQEESLRMGRLVNELLDLARMEAGSTQLNKEQIDTDVFIDRILKKFKGLADDNHIELTSEKHLSITAVTMDADRIEQVLTNLIDNAIRHTKDEGYVKVSINGTEEALNIAIEDNGSGIPEEDIPFVFERFYKADKSRARNTEKKGTGLGLAIAKNIVEAHEGTINVKSKLGEGTTFEIKLPLQS